MAYLRLIKNENCNKEFRPSAGAKLPAVELYTLNIMKKGYVTLHEK